MDTFFFLLQNLIQIFQFFRSFVMNNYELIRIQVQNYFDSIFNSVKDATKNWCEIPLCCHFFSLHQPMTKNQKPNKFICLYFLLLLLQAKKEKRLNRFSLLFSIITRIKESNFVFLCLVTS